MTRKMTKYGAISALKWLAAEMKDQELPGDARLLSDVARLLRKIPATKFPGGKNGK